MKKNSFTTLVLICLVLGIRAAAQNPLPDFNIDNKGDGRVVISWQNPYSNLIQLAVQRSYDSLKRFSTVYSATSPELPQNGFSDKITPGVRVYYKIFYVMVGGTYYFSNSKLANTVAQQVTITTAASRRDLLDESLLKKVTAENLLTNPDLYEPQRLYTVLVNDAPFQEMFTIQLKYFRDSILTRTRDTLMQVSNDTILVKQFVPPFEVRGSQYVYIDKQGYVVVNLPDAATKRYDLVLMEEDETPVLELKQIKEPFFMIDKSNFYHAGMYKFVLWENGRMKERNKFLLPKD